MQSSLVISILVLILSQVSSLHLLPLSLSSSIESRISYRPNNLLLGPSRASSTQLSSSSSSSSTSPAKSSSKSSSSTPATVVIAGATGRLGSEVVQAFLEYNADIQSNVNATSSPVKIKCLVREKSYDKAVSTFGQNKNDLLEIVKCDLTNAAQLTAAVSDASVCMWCATGFSDSSSVLDKLIGAFKLKFAPKSTIDISSIALIGKLFSDQLLSTKPLVEGGPRVVLVSSAGVTRPTWSEEKKAKFIGASDIPIVRLNPLNILGVKKDGEQALRSSKAPYTIVRPCGLNDKWPQGRPVVSQGDIAVGRVCRKDVAKFLVSVSLSPSAVGKTMEMFAIPNYPYPASFDMQFSRLRADNVNFFNTEDIVYADDALFAQYSLLQQLVPGEIMQPNKLAMGQTYEQLDQGKVGRLGERGTEEAPITLS